MKKLTDLQRLIGSFVIIVVLSMTMHVFVFSRRNHPRSEHYPVAFPVGSETDVASPAPALTVVGKVVVIGTDRYYVDTEKGRQMFFYGDLAHPVLGDHIRATLSPGDPPTVVKLERL